MIRSASQISAFAFFAIGAVAASSPQSVTPVFCQEEQKRPTWSGLFVIHPQNPGAKLLNSLPSCCPFGVMENVDFLRSPICGDFELGIFDNTDRIATPVFNGITFIMINGRVPEIKGDGRSNISLQIDFFDEYNNNLHSQLIRYWYENVLIEKGEKAPQTEIDNLPSDEGEKRMNDLIVPTNGTSFMHIAHAQLVRDWIGELKGASSDTKRIEDRLDPRILLPLTNPVHQAVRSLVTLTSQELRGGAGEPIVREKKWVTNIQKMESFEDILYRLLNHLFEQVRIEKEQIALHRQRVLAHGVPKTFAEEVDEISKRFYHNKAEGEVLSPEEKRQMAEEIKQANERQKKWEAEAKKRKARNLEEQKIDEAWKKRIEEF